MERLHIGLGVGAQSNLGERHFCPKNVYEKFFKMSEFYMILARKIIKIPELLCYLPEKLTKFPNFTHFFARKMFEF